MDHQKIFGLIGKPLGHSWSASYFNEKFSREGLSDCSYELFPIDSIDAFPDLVIRTPHLAGLNVTTPYKVAVMNHVTADEEARDIGAVNVVCIHRDRGRMRLTGHNTDRRAFTDSFGEFVRGRRHALVLGTGGASRAVVTALTHDLGMEAVLVSRQPAGKAIAYEDLKDTSFLRKFSLVVNATPLGMAPQVAGSPPVPFEHLSKDCVLVDLVYNPTETAFLRKGREYGLDGRGGLDMLHRQAEASWKIWNT